MANITDIWDKTKTLLRSEMTEASFTAWVECLTPLYIEKDRMLLLVPTDTVKDMLNKIYLPIIEDAVERATGSYYNIVLTDPVEQERMKAERALMGTMLNERYTFETFITGTNSDFAHAAAEAVANDPAKAYNPLLIYGGVGLGKTHLMHAIGHRVTQKFPGFRVVYVTSETFTNDVITAIKDNATPRLREKYRKADLLMVDDIQFLAGRISTQEEFFNTFNALHAAKKQIVLTSDRPPREITALEARIRDRCEWGLMADIKPPDLDTRVAILRSKAEQERIRVGDEVMTLIAENATSSVRQLEGSLTKLIAYSKLSSQPITTQMAEKVLSDILPGCAVREISIDAIKSAVANYYGISKDSLESSRRTADITYPRQIAMYLCNKLTGFALKTIGLAFGGRDHSTVISACRKIESEMELNEKTALAIEDLTARIKRG